MTDFRTCPDCLGRASETCATCAGTGERLVSVDALQTAFTAAQWARGLVDTLIADWKSVTKVSVPFGRPTWALRDQNIRITWDGRPNEIILPVVWMALSRDERLAAMRGHHQRVEVEKARKAHADRRRALEERRARAARELLAIKNEALSLVEAETQLFPVHQQKELDAMTNPETPIAETQLVQTVLDGKLSTSELVACANDPHQALTLLDAWSYAGLRGLSHEAFFTERGITDRESYIAHRDALKKALRLTAAYQKQLSLRMRRKGGDSDAQWRKAAMKRTVTHLIEIRRAGKAWSAEAAQARRAAA